MFNNTIVDENKCNIPDISTSYLDASEEKNLFLVDSLRIRKSFLIAYNGWHDINGKLYYFKNLKIFNEIFLSELIKEYNIKNVEYSFARSGSHLGIISRNFRNKNKKYVDYDYFFEQHHMDVPSSLPGLYNAFEKLLSKNNLSELMNTFYRLTAFDWFTGQTDRSSGNIIFECSNKIELAPLTDNGSSLQGLPTNRCRDFDILYSRLLSIYENLAFPYNDEVSARNKYLFCLINNCEEFKRYLEISLGININEILNRTIEKYSLIVPDCDREELINYFNIKKSIIERTLCLSEKHK